ncbi:MULTISPECIES: AMP-binding protein [Desulfitobacterium]|uniref:Acyl-CoA synthetase (AMP-forming)/AMP-acid ligase II n=1 Tax=Desulfitobacterium dehalogenans (strain ATCC 51507 / DSM 9161 / JW/IU-DC1) TaxID=756499 RepID=I4A6M4_DESDJ|nr:MULTISPECIES: AMP-binding protein [Desulfitobacterium]AFL99608.1 acyl-CoA synthetase (AMP-forming)/AMP-acid ligase II [Desulfitobacterium dehalogenans ATCC 51507]
MVRLIDVLFKIGLFSPLRLYSFASALHKYGINIMALLSFAEKAYGKKIGLVDDNETLTYKELYLQSKELSFILREKYQLRRGHKVGFICKNHASLVKAIFAVSQSGADIYLLNAEMSCSQFNNLLDQTDFHLLIYDFESSPLLEGSAYKKDKLLSYHEDLPAINNLLNLSLPENPKIKRSLTGKLVILTGGTTGNAKAAVHQPSLRNYLNPFVTLINRLKLVNYRTVYIATPIYHGYGIAVLLVFIILGKKVIIQKGFNVVKACHLIRKHQVEVVTVVPLMIYKMLKQNPEDLKSLACIVSGGAELNPRVVRETAEKLGDVLYNLYGTSEAGLNIIATPQDLRCSANTLGKKIKGVRLKIMDGNKNKVPVGSVGQFCIKNRWSMGNKSNPWIETGDLGYCDHQGYYFLCGRADDMVVSAGENVYPADLEQVLRDHPHIEEVAVIGIRDEGFGQRLKAFVLPEEGAGLTEEELLEWLRPRVARFQVPKEITFVQEMPYTSLGKLDKKLLRSND